MSDLKPPSASKKDVVMQDESQHREAMIDVFKGPKVDIYGDTGMEDPSDEDEQAQVVSNNRQRDKSPIQPQSVPNDNDVPMTDNRNLDDVLNEAENRTLDPELRRAMDFISKTIDQLKNGDLLRRVDALVEINDAISAMSSKSSSGATPGETPAGPSTEAEYQVQALIK